MMMTFPPSVYWLFVGLIAICIEILAPGISMLGTGFAAILTGILAYLVSPMKIEWQLTVFSLFAIALTWVCKRWISRSLQSDRPMLNEPQKQMIGLEFYTDHPIEKGKARMQVHGTYWTILGPNVPLNTKVTIVKVIDSHTLCVEPSE